MTRDEAIDIEKSKLKKVRHLSDNYVNDMATANIDALIELGLLKVDEPKSLQAKINEAVWTYLWPTTEPLGRLAPMQIVDALNKGGLKIVEK